MSKFSVGDRVVVVHAQGSDEFNGSRGVVSRLLSDDMTYPIEVDLPEGEGVPFKPEELEFEHVYDELSKKPEVAIGANLSDEGKAYLSKLVSLTDSILVSSDDVVSHPSHYADGWSNGAEVIDITENLNFNRGNAVKYLARAGKKGGPEKELEDLQKALWYVTREVERLGGSVD